MTDTDELGCVYFIKHKNMEPIKIGYSTHNIPNGRVQHANSSSPYGIELIGFIRTNTAKQLETELHEKFKHLRLNGEWFEISIETVRATIKLYDSTYDQRLHEAMIFLESDDMPCPKCKSNEMWIKRPIVIGETTVAERMNDIFLEYTSTCFPTIVDESNWWHKAQFINYCMKQLKISQRQIYKYFKNGKEIFNTAKIGCNVYIQLKDG